jgi:hypothetical protein
MGASSLLFSPGVPVAMARRYTACAAFPQADCEQGERGLHHAAMIIPQKINEMKTKIPSGVRALDGKFNTGKETSNVNSNSIAKRVARQTIHRRRVHFSLGATCKRHSTFHRTDH